MTIITTTNQSFAQPANYKNPQPFSQCYDLCICLQWQNQLVLSKWETLAHLLTKFRPVTLSSTSIHGRKLIAVASHQPAVISSLCFWPPNLCTHHLLNFSWFTSSTWHQHLILAYLPHHPRSGHKEVLLLTMQKTRHVPSATHFSQTNPILGMAAFLHLK